MQLSDLEAMVRLISKRGGLSSPGLNDIIFPFLKLEKASAALMIIEMMLFMIVQSKIPNIWKTGKTILIHIAGNINNPCNWRPITLTSAIYRILFRSIAQVRI
jgi:hypothetical protein